MEQVDGIRLEQFRQLRKEIQRSDEYLIVGIDVSKDRHHAFFRTATGRTLFKRLVFENSYEGFERLLNQVEVLRLENGLREVVFGMEPTGNYHKPLGEFLIRRLAQVVLVSNVAAKENRKSLDGRWDKHDAKDAANVADLVSQGKFLFYEYPEVRIKELRVLLALKRKLKRQEHGYRVRIRNHLVAKYFPELDRYFDQSEKYSLAIVRWCLDPRSLSGYEFDEFVRMVAPQMRGGQQEDRLRTILQMARNSIGCEMGPGAEFEARVMVEGLRQIRIVIGDTDKQIQELCQQFSEYEYLVEPSGIWSGCIVQGFGGGGRSLSFSEWESGPQDGGIGFECGAEWKEGGIRSAGDFEEGEGRFALCPLPSRLHCFDEESPFYGLLHEPIAGPGKGAGNQDQDAG